VVIGKLLDWPVLLFILIVFFAIRSGQSVAELLKGRKFDVELGGNKLSIGDAVQALDEETKQAVDDFRKHQEEINSLKARVARGSVGGGQTCCAKTKRATENQAEAITESSAAGNRLDARTSSEDRREAAFKRMIAAMSNSKFRWRTVERLAIEAGVSETEAHEILAAHHPREVVLGRVLINRRARIRRV
jgi:hypothetical protein